MGTRWMREWAASIDVEFVKRVLRRQNARKRNEWPVAVVTSLTPLLTRSCHPSM